MFRRRAGNAIREAVPVRAEELVGIPFKFGGRDRAGADCWGVVVLYFRDVCGITISDPLVYDVDPRGGGDLFEKHLGSEWVEVNDLRRIFENDLLTFADQQPGIGTHCGVLVANRRLLHTSSRTGASMLTRFVLLRDKVFKAYRHNGAARSY